jgi:hypothetical protein
VSLLFASTIFLFGLVIRLIIEFMVNYSESLCADFEGFLFAIEAIFLMDDRLEVADIFDNVIIA